MADGTTIPGYSWTQGLAGVLGQFNPNSPQNQQRQLLQALAARNQNQRGGFGTQPSTPSPQTSLGPSYQPGGAGYGTYEGNIRTAANPYGTQTPNLGAPNPPTAQAPTPPQGLPTPAQAAPPNPWTAFGTSPVSYTSQTGPPGLPGFSQIPYGTAGGGLNALSSLGQASQAQNPMMSALFSPWLQGA